VFTRFSAAPLATSAGEAAYPSQRGYPGDALRQAAVRVFDDTKPPQFGDGRLGDMRLLTLHGQRGDTAQRFYRWKRKLAGMGIAQLPFWAVP